MKLKDMRLECFETIWGISIRLKGSITISSLYWGRKRGLSSKRQAIAFAKRLCKAFNEAQEGK